MFQRLKKQHDFMWSYSLEVLRSFTRPSFVFLLMLTATLVLLSAFGFYALERNVNPHIHSYFDALYFAVTVMTSVGLGDVHPVSIAGKVMAMAMMILGTGLFVSFTAVLAASILELERKNKSP